jgi:hypothetical protein
MLLELPEESRKQALEELDPKGASRRGSTDRPALPPNSSLTLYLSISKRLVEPLADYMTNLLLVTISER